MKQYEYLLKRLLLFIPILWGVSVVVFLLIHLVPGSPAAANLGVRATPERVEQLERQMGLHEPLLQQYIDWTLNALQGDLGTSLSSNLPVSSILVDRFLVSFQLVLMTMIATVIIAIPLGIFAAKNKDTKVDYFSIGFGIVGISLPTFFSAVLLIAVFGVWLGVAPISGYVSPRESIVQNINHMVLPTIALTIVATAVTMRMMRSSMLETIGDEYINFLRAKGLRTRSIIFVHATKNSLIPVVTILGLQFGYMLSGTVVIEEIFSIPGLGRTLLQSVLDRDYPLVQGSVLLIALWFAIVNLITDLMITYLDPRVMEEDQ